ncbi:MAG: hypothetical protein IPQ02_18490 [Saprospiraceae bacterium]|nr:hypothetical protein [Candidatus Defluviibacterium haderslevense]
MNLEIEEGTVVAGQTYKMNVKSSDFASTSQAAILLKYDSGSLVCEG